MKCSKSNPDSKKLCIEALKSGKVLILPTDTVYGFSALVSPQFDCDVKIRKIKGRAETKPFIQLISSPEDIKKYSDDVIPENLLKYWPGPLTIIVKDKRLSESEIKTTAFRCPGDKWLRNILKECDFPIYSTSVNRSGFPVLETEKEITEEFEQEVDLIILDGDKTNSKPSTLVSLDNGQIKVLRQGEIELN